MSVLCSSTLVIEKGWKVAYELKRFHEVCCVDHSVRGWLQTIDINLESIEHCENSSKKYKRSNDNSF